MKVENFNPNKLLKPKEDDPLAEIAPHVDPGLASRH